MVRWWFLLLNKHVLAFTLYTCPYISFLHCVGWVLLLFLVHAIPSYHLVCLLPFHLLSVIICLLTFCAGLLLFAPRAPSPPSNEQGQAWWVGLISLSTSKTK